jgi:hypothetical protein
VADTNLEQVLADLHDEVAKDLLVKVRSGEAGAAVITAAIKLLQHNGVQSNPKAKANPLFDLKAAVDSLGLELPN